MATDTFTTDSQLRQRPIVHGWLASVSRDAWITGRSPDSSPTSSQAGVARRELAPGLLLTPESGYSLPSSAADSCCAGIFDGVLYNRQELAERFGLPISATGDGLATSDAALVLQTYRHHGAEFVHYIKGIFALLLWDSQRRLLIAARDPLGVYPLFYVDTGHDFLLSTGYEPLLGHPNV